MKNTLVRVCVVSAVMMCYCSVAKGSEDIEVRRDSDNIILIIEGMQSVKSKRVQININLEDLKKSSLKEIPDDSQAETSEHNYEVKNKGRFGDIIATIEGMRSKKGKIKIRLSRLKKHFFT